MGENNHTNNKNINENESNNNVDYFILESIYLSLCQNMYTDEPLKYNSNYLFLSCIPDFIENNETHFINHKKKKYVNFIKNKIDEYITCKKIYALKPSILILIKIVLLFEKEFDDYNYHILSNQILNYIQYLKSANLLIYSNNIIIDNKLDAIDYDYVLDSSIMQFYDKLINREGFYNYCNKLFYIKKSYYHLLASEFDYIDNNFNLQSQKYNNLKFMLFLASINQYAVMYEENRFNHLYFFDTSNPPNPNSIKFVIFMSWLIYQKTLNKPVNIPDNYFINIDLNLNINKFFNLFLIIPNEIFNKVFNFVCNTSNIEFKFSDKYNIDEIFDTDNNFISNKLDYEINLDNLTNYDYITQNTDINNPNNNPKHNPNNNPNNNLIMAFGGSLEEPNKIKLPIEPFNKISYYIHYIKK